MVSHMAQAQVRPPRQCSLQAAPLSFTHSCTHSHSILAQITLHAAPETSFCACIDRLADLHTRPPPPIRLPASSSAVRRCDTGTARHWHTPSLSPVSPRDGGSWGKRGRVRGHGDGAQKAWRRPDPDLVVVPDPLQRLPLLHELLHREQALVRLVDPVKGFKVVLVLVRRSDQGAVLRSRGRAKGKRERGLQWGRRGPAPPAARPACRGRREREERGV